MYIRRHFLSAFANNIPRRAKNGIIGGKAETNGDECVEKWNGEFFVVHMHEWTYYIRRV